MSKLMGKIFLKGRGESVSSGFFEFSKQKLYVRYLKTSDSFEFKGLRLTKKDQEAELGMKLSEIGEGFEANRLIVSSSVLSAMIMADKIDDIIYHWSVGYEAREKLGNRPGDFKLLSEREKKFVFDSCGNVLSASLDFDAYIDLSVWQYLYNISETILVSVRRLWKKKSWGRASSRWKELSRRENFGGRVVGSVNVSSSDGTGDEFGVETDEDFFLRIEHNKKVAVSKGFLVWYLEACKEECKRRGVPFSREECVSKWNKLRENVIDF